MYKDTVWHKDQTGPLASIYGLNTAESGEKEDAEDVEDQSDE